MGVIAGGVGREEMELHAMVQPYHTLIVFAHGSEIRQFEIAKI
jgi:hypothetical protein